MIFQHFISDLFSNLVTFYTLTSIRAGGEVMISMLTEFLEGKLIFVDTISICTSAFQSAGQFFKINSKIKSLHLCCNEKLK